MQSIILKDTEKTLRQALKKVNQDHEPILLDGGEEQASGVLISYEDYRSLEETSYLLRSPKNAKRLGQALSDTKNGHYQERALLEE